MDLNEPEKKPRKKRAGKKSETYQFLCRQVGTLIRERRKELGFSQTSLAKAAGITVSFLSDVEHSRTLPALETFRNLCDLLGIEATIPSHPPHLKLSPISLAERE